MRVRVIDKDGGSNVYTATVTVNNVKPTAALANSSVDEGSTAPVGATDVADPGDLATVRYVYDLDGNAHRRHRRGHVRRRLDGDDRERPREPDRRRPGHGPRARQGDRQGRRVQRLHGQRDRGQRRAVVHAERDHARSTRARSPRPRSPASPTPRPPTAPPGRATRTTSTTTAPTTSAGPPTPPPRRWRRRTCPAALTADGPGTHRVRIAVVDKDGGLRSDTIDVVVDNVAPTATLADVTAEEGTNATVAFTGADDVSAADKAAGFTFEWDVDGDGTFDKGAGSIVVARPGRPAHEDDQGRDHRPRRRPPRVHDHADRHQRRPDRGDQRSGRGPVLGRDHAHAPARGRRRRHASPPSWTGATARPRRSPAPARRPRATPTPSPARRRSRWSPPTPTAPRAPWPATP